MESDEEPFPPGYVPEEYEEAEDVDEDEDCPELTDSSSDEDEEFIPHYTPCESRLAKGGTAGKRKRARGGGRGSWAPGKTEPKSAGSGQRLPPPTTPPATLGAARCEDYPELVRADSSSDEDEELIPHYTPCESPSHARDRGTIHDRKEEYTVDAALVGLSPAHAEVLLNRLAKGGTAGKRKRPERRGEYTKWSAPDNAARMDASLREWLDFETHKPRGKRRSLKNFCEQQKPFPIPPATFHQRLQQSDPYQNPPRQGRPPLVSDADADAICDIVARLDQLNCGLDVAEIIDMMADMLVESPVQLTSQQLQNTWQHRIKRNPKLTSRVKVEATTKDRSGAITELAQRRYMQLVAQMENLCALKSVGEDKATGKTWRELQEHFTANLDEEGLMASLDGEHVIGWAGKRDHQRNSKGSRVSITGVKTGTAAGEKAPHVYLLQGVEGDKPKSPYDKSKWLEANGAPPGSRVIMTPSAYMTNTVWDQVALIVAKGLRNLPVVRDNPDWWIILYLDGFESHTNTAAAQAIFTEHKIFVVKENSHSSHINQAFDDQPALQNKRAMKHWCPHPSISPHSHTTTPFTPHLTATPPRQSHHYTHTRAHHHTHRAGGGGVYMLIPSQSHPTGSLTFAAHRTSSRAT
jgi:hypothetical protein